MCLTAFCNCFYFVGSYKYKAVSIQYDVYDIKFSSDSVYTERYMGLPDENSHAYNVSH